MSKHDSWVILRPNSPYKSIEYLFPEGFPVRDPFPLLRAKDGAAVLWLIDIERLDGSQTSAIASILVKKYQVEKSIILADAQKSGGFCLNHDWVSQLFCGAEGITRTAEAKEFFDSGKSFQDFLEQQERDWIIGNKQPEIILNQLQVFTTENLCITITKIQNKHEQNRRISTER